MHFFLFSGYTFPSHSTSQMAWLDMDASRPVWTKATTRWYRLRHPVSSSRQYRPLGTLQHPVVVAPQWWTVPTVAAKSATVSLETETYSTEVQAKFFGRDLFSIGCPMNWWWKFSSGSTAASCAISHECANALNRSYGVQTCGNSSKSKARQM